MIRQKYIIFTLVALVILIGVGALLSSPRTQLPTVPLFDDIKAPSTTAPTPPSTQSEYPEWKKYKNTKYGYEIQYPPEWEAWFILPNDDTIYPAYGDVESGPRLGPPYRDDKRLIGGEIHIGVSKKAGIFAAVETYEDLVQVLQGKDWYDQYYAKTGVEIDVGSERALKYEGSAQGGLPYTAVYVAHGDYVYSFIAGYENEKWPPSKTFPKILSTFKFIESGKPNQ